MPDHSFVLRNVPVESGSVSRFQCAKCHGSHLRKRSVKAVAIGIVVVLVALCALSAWIGLR